MDALAAIRSLADLKFRDACGWTKTEDMGYGSATSTSNSSASLSSSSSSSSGRTSGHSSADAECDEAAVVKVIDFRGQKVAAFDVHGKEMICLPQVYELFLKKMVGGLHTVYTKLRRLDISPLICNVEQVRALRSLGAIQPGVNRCKLIESCDFDKLYDDCTSTCTRPGRPSKRGSFDDYYSSLKKDKPEGSQERTNDVALFGQFLPLTTQQLLMQHFVAIAVSQQHNINANFDTSDDGDDEGRNEEEDEDLGAPLNLTKSTPSDGDTDSMENMRKDDSSPNNSMSDRGGSNDSNSASMGGSVRTEESLVAKVLSLIEIANEQFKHERDELWRERNEVRLMRESFHNVMQDERCLRVQLESQTRKCSAYERKYKRTRRELLLTKAKLRRSTH